MGTAEDNSIPDPQFRGIPTLRPESRIEVAQALRRAADARQSVLIRGAATKLGWGRPAAHVDTILDMRALNRVLAHDHADMTATVEAGASLAAVNGALAQYGQWLPLDPPHADTATIGGILATNDSGPLRHRYGTPRDLLIGVELATADGVLSKSGGRVVKNVAGYDLGKLVTGSFGGLAAIATATFKLAPRPAASKTLRLEAADATALSEIVKTVMSSQLEPIAFEIASPGRVLIRFASLPQVVDAQIPRARSLLARFALAAEVFQGDREQDVWRDHAAAIWRGTGDDAIVRGSWLPADVEQLMAIAPGPLVGRAAIGAGLIRIGGTVDAQANAIERLRSSSGIGNVVIVHGSVALKTRVDVWGSAGDRRPVFDALKRALDPHNVLNAGRGPL